MQPRESSADGLSILHPNVAPIQGAAWGAWLDYPVLILPQKADHGANGIDKYFLKDSLGQGKPLRLDCGHQRAVRPVSLPLSAITMNYIPV